MLGDDRSAESMRAGIVILALLLAIAFLVHVQRAADSRHDSGNPALSGEVRG
jgi:hypothetical protein